MTPTTNIQIPSLNTSPPTRPFKLRTKLRTAPSVLDECHTPLDSTPEFRPKMRQLGELMESGVQMVYLAATLPPHANPHVNSCAFAERRIE
jgi:superfamily II DNA helicase RecQ